MGKPARKPPEVKAGLPGWVATYSDLVTLLLAFFVMLMAMANFENQTRVDAVVTSIKEALGSSGWNDAALAVALEPTLTRDERRQEAIQPVMAKLQDALGEHVSDDYIQMVHEDKELRVRLDERVFFQPGSSTLHPSALALLADVAQLLEPENVDIRVEGYADGQGDELDNWRLSSARSLSVLMALREKGPVAGERLEAVAYGSFHPGSSVGLDNPAWNRRIELVLQGDDVSGAAAANKLKDWGASDE